MMTPEQFDKWIRTDGLELVGAGTREGVNQAALAAKSAVLAVYRARVPSLTLRNFGPKRGGVRKGARLSVNYRLYGHVNAFAMLSTGGPTPILERGAKPHIIAPLIAKTSGRGAKARGVQSAAARRSGYLQGELGRRTGLPVGGTGEVRAWVHHPGLKGSRPFARAVDTVDVAFHVKRAIAESLTKG